MNVSFARRTLVLSTVVAISGCATPKDVEFAKERIITNDNANRQLLSAEHVKVMQDDLVGLQKQIEEANRADKELAQRLREETEAAGRKFEDIGKFLNSALGAAESIALGNVGGVVRNTIDAARSASDSSARGMVADARTATDTAIDAKFSLAAARIDEVKSDLSELDTKLDAIDPNLGEKLKALQGTVDAEIEGIQDKFKGQPEEMRQAIEDLLAAKGLSREEIDGLRGLGLDDLLTVLISGGVAVGGITGYARFGRSRSAPEIERLKQEVADIRSASTKT